MSEGSSSNSRSDINEIISNIVNHPSFRSTLNQILDVRSGATNVSNNHSTPSGVPTEELVDTASRPSQRYNSPAQEFSSIFQRGGFFLRRSISTWQESRQRIPLPKEPTCITSARWAVGPLNVQNTNSTSKFCKHQPSFINF